MYLTGNIVDIEFFLENLTSNSNFVAHTPRSFSTFTLAFSQAQAAQKADPRHEILLNKVHLEPLPRWSFVISFVFLRFIPLLFNIMLLARLPNLGTLGQGMMSCRIKSVFLRQICHDHINKWEIARNAMWNSQNRLILVRIMIVLGVHLEQN